MQGFLFLSMMNKITGIVIAGGKSTRMKHNKALIVYNKIRLIDNAIAIIDPFVSNLLVSSNEFIPAINYRIIKDEISNIGPIGGLLSCLKYSENELNIIIPCDTPHVSPHIYSLLIEKSENVDAVIPQLPNGKLEPLVACYKKSIIPVIEELINRGDYKLVNLFSKIKVKYLQIEDVLQFKNINTPEDLL